MDFNKISKILISIIICELAGAIGSVFTVSQINTWYKDLKKPFFSPPNWIFGPVWTALFLLMAVSLYLVWSASWKPKNEIIEKKANKKIWNRYSEKLAIGQWQKTNIILIFSFQLILNILWSVIFFGFHSPALAFFEILMLWFAILFTVVNFYRVSKAAAYLLLPYIIWVSFAGILNYFFWILN